MLKSYMYTCRSVRDVSTQSSHITHWQFNAIVDVMSDAGTKFLMIHVYTTPETYCYTYKLHISHHIYMEVGGMIATLFTTCTYMYMYTEPN